MFMFEVEEKGVQVGNGHIATATYQIREGGGGQAPAILRLGDDPDLVDLHDTLLERLQEVVTMAHFALNADGIDSMGVGIYGQDQAGQDVRVYVPLRQWDLLTAEHILEAIDNVLNSSQTLVLDFEIKFTVVHRDVGPNQILGGVSTFRGHLSTFLTGKKGIVIIHPTEDPYDRECLYQFCAMGLCYLLERGKIPIETFQRLQLPWAPTAYRSMNSHRNRFEYRHRTAAELLSCLHRHYENVHTLAPLDFIRCVEATFHCYIVLYNFKSAFARWYPLTRQLPVETLRPTFFGLLTQDGEDAHVDFVSTPTCLISKDLKRPKRMCMYCFEVYGRSRSCGVDECDKNQLDRCLFCHTCYGLCDTCMTLDCGARLPEDQRNEEQQPYRGAQPGCSTCHRPFYSQACQRIHQSVCSKIQNKKCDQCGRADHRSLKCDESYCMMCSEKIKTNEEHHCYIRNTEMKEPMTTYWAYDFETCMDSKKKHVLYLCTAWPLYPLPGVEELKQRYSTQDTRFPDQPVFIFWGLEGALQFFDFLLEPCLSGSHFFAHNGGRYDTIFIEYYMTIHKQLIANKIQRGMNEMQLYFPQLKIFFKDSRNFVNTALRNMSQDFGIEETRKGHFPHSVMTVEYFKQAEQQDFLVPVPDASYFQQEFTAGKRGVLEQEDLQQFLHTFLQQDRWNLKKDAVEYCISDTLLLGETLRKFREDTLAMTNPMPRPDHVKYVPFDPLRYVTLPSAVMKFYMSQMLPRQTISIIDRFPALQRIDEEKWLLWTEHTRGVRIARESFYLECPISGIYTHPDGRETLFRFLNCYENGCTQCHRGSAWNIRKNCNFRNCYQRHLQSTQKIRNNAPVTTRIVDCWTHEYLDVLDSKAFKLWEQDKSEFIESHTPLDPREAYKGGISEMYKLHVPGPIQMVDFVSQYPTAMIGESVDPYDPNKMLYWGLPCGQYRRIVHPNDYQVRLEVLGVIKCTVLPPQNLYAPFLSYRVHSRITSQSYEVLYGNCRTCMEERCLHCTHPVAQRCFTGTWTLMEIHYALSLGYQILKVIEVWEYDENRNDLFKEFMIPFIISKTCSKTGGLVEAGELTAKGLQTCAWLFQLTGKRFGAADFYDAPSIRNVAKLIMNSFYGKWGQRSQWVETRSYVQNQEKECMRLFGRTELTIRYVEVIHEHAELGPVVYVDYEHRLPAVKGDAQKNDHIAAHITAAGRVMINRLVQKMGRNSIYIDTDSLFHCWTATPPYTPGFKIGDLELELPMATFWVACARKWYSYLKEGGGHVAKQKGIALKSSTHNYFAPQSMLEFVQKTREVFLTLQEQGIPSEEAFTMMKKGKVEVPHIPVPQQNFKTVRVSKLVSYKQTVPLVKQATFLLWSLKRIPCWEPDEQGRLDTVPYGFVSSF